MAVEDKTPLNQIVYGSRDFPTYWDSLWRRLKAEYGDQYNDAESTGVGGMLIDLMAYGLSQLAWGLDRVANDSFLSTARTHDAVSRLVEQIGYKMQPAVSSSTTLTLTFAALPANGKMSAGFRFGGSGGLVFETVADVALTAGQTTVDVDVSEGETRRIKRVSDGSTNQRFTLAGIQDGLWVRSQSVSVSVNGTEWSEVDFLEYEKTNQYEVHYLASPPYVQFGDGIAGNIPTSGADVVISFVVMHGVDGNLKSGSITSAISTLVIGGQTIAIEVESPDAATSGNDPETVESARRLAPNSFASRGATITLDDYVALTHSFSDPQYGSPAKAYAYVVRESLEDPVFEGMLNDIKNEVRDHATLASTEESSMAAHVSTAGGLIDAVQLLNVDIGAKLSAIDVARTSAQTTTSTCKGLAASIGGSTDSIDATITSLISAINSSGASVGEKATMVALSGQIQNLTNTISSESTTIASACSSIATNCVTIEDRVDEAQAAMVTVTADMVLVETELGGIQSDVTSLSGDAEATKVAVWAKADDVEVYVDELFDNDCKCNCVTVPVLAKDQDGFYIAPSGGLLNALQVYLDDHKEVTQLVRVVSGAEGLLGAEVEILVSSEPGSIVSEVHAEIDAVVDGLLRDREYNEPLYLSDLYRVVRDSVDGYRYLNVEIIGPVAYLDSDGNLIPGVSRVVTKGSVVINEAV